jgi:hypothetical protein
MEVAYDKKPHTHDTFDFLEVRDVRKIHFNTGWKGLLERYSHHLNRILGDMLNISKLLVVPGQLR